MFHWVLNLSELWLPSAAEDRPHCPIYAAGVNKQSSTKDWTSRKSDMDSGKMWHLRAGSLTLMPDDPAFPCLVISLFWTGSTLNTIKVNTQLSQLPLHLPPKNFWLQFWSFHATKSQTTSPGLHICSVLRGSRPTCNPRGHVSAHSHTLFTTVRQSAQCGTCRLCLHAVPSWKGRRHTPGFPVLLWKQGSPGGQWEGRDYDMCFCARESIKQRCLFWQCVGGGDFNQLTQGRKHTGQ